MVATEQQKATFAEFARQIVAKGISGLLEEFHTEVKGYGGPTEKTAFEANPTKNRYPDVVCPDGNRVCLTDGRGPDYIHANLVRTGQTTFIATQGPMSTTCVDFWRMVAVCEVRVVVMLCHLTEQGKRKCEPYFPSQPGEILAFGDYKVCFVEALAIDGYFDRTQLRLLCPDGTTRDVRHYHFKAWPDKQVPKSLRAVLRLLVYVRSKEPNPVVVHCSAGIGRTGSFIAVEMLLQSLSAGIGQPSLLEVAKRLRDQRPGAIQAEQQYVAVAMMALVYGVALQIITEPELLEQLAQLTKDFEAMLATANGGGGHLRNEIKEHKN